MASMKTTSPLEIFKLREAERTWFCVFDLEATNWKIFSYFFVIFCGILLPRLLILWKKTIKNTHCCIQGSGHRAMQSFSLYSEVLFAPMVWNIHVICATNDISASQFEFCGWKKNMRKYSNLFEKKWSNDKNLDDIVRLFFGLLSTFPLP